VRPILSKSFVLRPLPTSNFHIKFQVSTSYRSRDVLITDRQTHETLAQTNFFGLGQKCPKTSSRNVKKQVGHISADYNTFLIYRISD
ncbi:hypothetical protein WDU94_012256, partial [Cyamophila willieti]